MYLTLKMGFKTWNLCQGSCLEKNIEIIDLGLLIENIYMAFKVWEMERTRLLSLDEFCEYILPYNSSDENLNMEYN